MIFKLGQIISLGVLGGAGGYLIYKSKPSTKRIEAEYYEKLEEEKKLRKENELQDPSLTSSDITSTENNLHLTKSQEEEEDLSTKKSSTFVDTLKNRTSQLKNRIQKENMSKGTTTDVSESVGGEPSLEERTTQRNRSYSNFYENYRKSNEVLLRGKENAGLRRRYEDIKRIHNYCRNNNN